MATLPQLIDPDHYQPCDWNLRNEPAALEQWLVLFCGHVDLVIEHIKEAYPHATADQLAAFRTEHIATFERVRDARHEHIDILMLTHLRREVQDRHGFRDPFLAVKQRENGIALRLLPEILAELDAEPAERQLELLARNLMAGNVFDLGAVPAIARFQAGDATLRKTRDSLSPRPWFVDNLAEFTQRLTAGPAYQHLMMFVDNAGSDVCLGCLPLARWFSQRGTRVTLAANSYPALNDITAEDLPALLRAAGEIDAALQTALESGLIRVIPSGCTTPLIDLSKLSEECTATAADIDLLMLHGMGRAIESNARARFTCDTLRTAMIKDQGVATHIGAQLFDCVFRYTPADT